MIYDSQLAGIATSGAQLTIKDWGLVYQDDSGGASDLQFWVSRQNNGFLIRWPGGSLTGDADGNVHASGSIYSNGKLVQTAS